MESNQGTLLRGAEVRKDDFWEALSSNYDYLMNDELIATCREASGELALDEAGVSPSRDTLSFADFVQQFNLLHDWLHRLQSSLLDCTPDQKSEMATLVEGELHQRGTSLLVFIEEAQALGALHPSMKEEVNRRVNLLCNKRDAVKRAIDPASASPPTQGEAFQEVAHEMRCLRRWLRELEARLPNQAAGSSSWTISEIQEKLKAQQALQQEIESRSRLVKSLLRQCEALCLETTPFVGQSGTAQGGDQQQNQQQQHANLSSEQPAIPQTFFPNDAQRIRRVASNLEKRWHGLWLRSLEWQCLLEQYLQGSQDVHNWDAGSERGYGDEPRTKQPRLSCEWDRPSSASTMDLMLDLAPDQPDSEREMLEHRRFVAPVPPTHLEKGVMVGSTGIAELKVSCKGRRFEILHDVGYSSESSTQLSSEDCIRVYSYSPESSLFREYRDGAPCDNGHGAVPLRTPEEEEEEGEYEASPLVQSGVSNSDFYKMTSLEEAAFSDQNEPACEADVEDMDLLEGNEVVVKKSGKSARVREWLENCEAPLTAAEASEEEPSETPGRVDSSCDASGEYTTNDESDGCHESDEASSRSSQGPDTSRSMSLLSKSGTGSVETVVQVGASQALSEGDFAPRVVLRSGGSRKKRSRERPWSVTELGQSGGLQLSLHSTSETALNALLATSPSKTQEGRARTCSVGVQKDPPSPDRRPRKSRGLRLRSGSSSEGLSGSSSAQKRPNSQESGRRVRRTSTASHSTGSLQNISSSSGTENYQDCVGVLPGISKGHLAARPPVLSHVEEQSSVSDQVWDDYQDPPYFSEPYSEQTADEDQVKKLLDFGDDYGAFIGSHSDTSSLSGHPRDAPRRSPLRARPAAKNPGGTEFDSDSDIEELHHLLNQSSRAHSFIRNTLRKMALANQDYDLQHGSSKEKMSPPKFAELVATCQTNLHWLKMIRIHLHTGEDSPQLQKLISQWEALVAELQGNSTAGGVPSSKRNNLRATRKDTAVVTSAPVSTDQQRAEVLQDIGSLQRELSTLSELVQRPSPMEVHQNGQSPQCSFAAVEQRAQELKVALSSLNDIRASLLDVKVKAHRLEGRRSSDSMEAILGDHIKELYRQLDDTYEQSGSKLTELQTLHNQWQAQRASPSQLDSRKMASLESRPPSLLDASAPENKGRAKDVPQSIGTKSSPPVPVDEGKEGSGRRRLWRVLKAALPVQVALMLLYCVACLMEPHCCDLLNNFHTSFGPQLRYSQGPPPV